MQDGPIARREGSDEELGVGFFLTEDPRSLGLLVQKDVHGFLVRQNIKNNTHMAKLSDGAMKREREISDCTKLIFHPISS